MTIRARDLGIPLRGTPGPHNAITDVKGVHVGHKTLISGDGPLVVGQGPVRTGVTVVLPRGPVYDAVFAAVYSFNGNGEMTGTHWIDESGFLEGPIGITNTHSVGVVRDAIVAWQRDRGLYNPLYPFVWWSLPVVAETWDGRLNDVNGQHVSAAHVYEAFAAASTEPPEEGGVGGGTGMVCHGFKSGIGTASRVLADGYTVGVLVQANYGARDLLTVAGVPVGQELADWTPDSNNGTGSIIVIVATDAPLLPHQLKRLAKRVPLGIGRVGGLGENTSGDIFIAFSTANSGAAARQGVAQVEMLPNDALSPYFAAVAEATEEAILNALVAAKTMTGINDVTIPALPHDRLCDILRKYNRLQEPS